MAEILGKYVANSTLGAQFLGNLAAAVYVAILRALPNGEVIIVDVYISTVSTASHVYRPTCFTGRTTRTLWPLDF